LEVNIGNTVWFHNYHGVDSGVVIDILYKSHSTSLACVKLSDSFSTIEVDSRKMYLTRSEAVLALAEKKQQEAARLLTDAAGLFKQAGGMKEAAQ
jgi:hypothetical protein